MLHMVRLSSLFRTYHQHCSYKGIYILLINTIPPPLSIFNREYRLLSILFFFPFRPILFTCHNSEEIHFMFHRLSTRQHDVKRIGLYNHYLYCTLQWAICYNGAIDRLFIPKHQNQIHHSNVAKNRHPQWDQEIRKELPWNTFSKQSPSYANKFQLGKQLLLQV